MSGAPRLAPVGADLLASDQAHLWHPYTAMTDPFPVRLVTGAAGTRLHLADGSDVVDGMASWWSAIHGYRHPTLDEAVRKQVDSFAHVMFGGLTHEPAILLGEKLVELSGLPHVFLADSGSVSVEVALKMARQFQMGQGEHGRTRIAALSGGYHGDTLGAMSVCDPVGGMHSMYADALPPQVFLPLPPGGVHRSAEDPAVREWAAASRETIEAHSDQLAAIIAEPVLQGAGGMRVYPPVCLQILRDLADEHGLLLILDEIATGFGRTGRFWGAEHAGVTADIVCVGKALTGGYLTLGATLCSTEVASGIAASPAGVLMHGPTFMGNPLACQVALASLNLLDATDWQANVARIEQALRSGLAQAATLPEVAAVRVLGAVGVIETVEPVDVADATATALDAGVWLRPFRNLIYTMPPYIASTDDVDRICRAMTLAATR